jgi:phosphate transport system substrate-binding protein
MRTWINTLLFLCLALSLGCRDPYTNTPTTGRIKIGVDDTFKPVAEAELMVFQGLYKFAEITPIYQPENECFKLLTDDSVQLIIAARALRPDEKKLLDDRKFIAREVMIAIDAVALVVNPNNKDTIFTLQALEQIMTGKITEWNQINPDSPLGPVSVVFDNKNSSIVHYVADSICRGQSLTGNLYALDSNLDVVDYVSRNEDALGLIGVSWISDQDDTTQLSFLKKVRVVSLSKEETATFDNSFKPFQAYIYDKSYPLTREVYAINAEPRNGLATGFVSFLASDRGQRIILKSGILPATQPVRLVNVRENF